MRTQPGQAATEGTGQPSLGTWLSLGSITAARFLARAGFAWLTVDIEHSLVDWETATHMFAAIADAGCVALARVPANRHDHIKRVLDNGAHGVVVPMVNTAPGGRGRRRRLPVPAARQPLRRRQRPRPELRHHAGRLLRAGQRRAADRPPVRAHPGGRERRRASSRCRASTPSSSARTTWRRACAARTASRPSAEATSAGDDAHPGDVQEAQGRGRASTATAPRRRKARIDGGLAVHRAGSELKMMLDGAAAVLGPLAAAPPPKSPRPTGG